MINDVRALLPFLLIASGCGIIGGDDEDEPTLDGLAVLGNMSHDVSSRLEVMGDSKDGLSKPQDLAFNPDVPGELWVVNKKDDSVSIFDNAGGPDQDSEHIVDPFALHFMDQVTSIAFGKPGTFATCQDSNNDYNGSYTANDFMGPTLWSSDRDVFGTSNPEAVEALTELFGFYTDLGSHLDMLHESPNCMGIAWDKRNIYWVFDGFHDSINRYDFKEDHGVGWDDHSDGVIGRWVEGEVKRKAGVPSHLVLDHVSGLLYIADTGNNRVAVLDTNSGKKGDSLPGFEPGVDHYEQDNGDIWTLVDGDVLGMEAPSGIDLLDSVLYVTDNGTGRIHAFDLDGNEIDWAETGVEPGGLAGIYALTSSELWMIDSKGKELLRLME